MALEELEKNLYNPDREKIGREAKPALPSPTEKSGEENALSGWSKKTSAALEEAPSALALKFFRFGRFFFWLLIAGSIILIGLGSYYFYEYTKSRDVSLDLSAPAAALIGVPFDLNLILTNHSDRPAEEVKLMLVLPDGAFLPEDMTKRISREDLGNVEPGASVEKKITVVLYNTPSAIQKFQATASYYPPSLGPNTRFSKTAETDIQVGDPAVRLDLAAPQKVLNGENFEINISYANISGISFPNSEIEIDLPPSFNFKSVSPTSTAERNIWKFASLDKNASGTIAIEGNIIAAEQSFFDVKVSVKTGGHLINQKTAGVNIAASPLSLGVNVNGRMDYIPKTSDNLTYSVSYRNNSEVGLSDAVLKVKLTGAMFDFTTLSSKGFFSSRDDTITWNAGNTPELRVLQPGQSGILNFEIRTKSGYPVRRLADKNFTLSVDAEMSSPTVPYYVAADRTVGLVHFETKVSGQITIQGLALYADPDSPKNTGPMPPRVNSPTTFTIHWLVTNYATDAKNIFVKTVLPAGVRFTGNAKSNVGSVPVYNDRTSEVSWIIDSLVATKGVLSKPAEAVFQIEATPNITEVGQPMPILGDTSLQAVDDFTELPLLSSAPALTTALQNDPTLTPSQYIVNQ